MEFEWIGICRAAREGRQVWNFDWRQERVSLRAKTDQRLPPVKGGSTKEGITDLEDLGIEVGIPTGGNGVGRKERTTAKAKMPST
jgi:hypothetical protein